MEAWSEELYHHGIKDMHWGVRRYQKHDGSLTAAGRKRYNDSDEIYHYGVPKKSGRYPWGSGENPFHHTGKELRNKGKLTEKREQEEVRERRAREIGRRNWELAQERDEIANREVNDLIAAFNNATEKDVDGRLMPHTAAERKKLEEDANIIINFYEANRKNHAGSLKLGDAEYDKAVDDYADLRKRLKKMKEETAAKVSAEEEKVKSSKKDSKPEPPKTATEESKEALPKPESESKNFKKSKKIDKSDSSNLETNQNSENIKDARKISSADVQKTLGASSKVASGLSSLAKKSANAERERMKAEMDLSSLSDNDLRAYINRQSLERTYKNMKVENVRTGADRVADILSVSGDVLSVGASAVELIRAFRG